MKASTFTIPQGKDANLELLRAAVAEAAATLRSYVSKWYAVHGAFLSFSIFETRPG